MLHIFFLLPSIKKRLLYNLYSMRGSNTLFSDIFIDDNPPVKTGKGRSVALHDARNEALISRYYYYGKFFDNKLKYDWIINTVAKEFWLSPVTVPEIIDDNFAVLANLKKQQPALKFFKEKYPHLVWDKA